MTRLDAARHRVAETIGGYGSFQAIAGGTTSTVICPAAFQSTELPTSALAYAWLYYPGGNYPRQRRVKKDGLTAGSGTIALEGALADTIPVNGIFELHSKLPAAREAPALTGSGVIMGVHECLLAALRHLLVEGERSLSLVNGQQDYPLTDSWLDRRERLVDVRQTNAFGTASASSPRTFELWPTPGGSTLHFHQPFRIQTAKAVSLVVKRPADTTVKLSGASSWTDSTTGPTAEGDEAAPDLESWTTVAMVFASRALAASRKGAERKKYEADYDFWLTEARKLKTYDHTNDIAAASAQATAPAATGAS